MKTNYEITAIKKFIDNEKIYNFIGDEIVWCSICRCNIKCKTNKGIGPLKEHSSTKKHLKILETEASKKKNIDYDDKITEVILWMMKNNIPLTKIDNHDFKYLFEDIFGMNFKSYNHYKENLLPQMYENEKFLIYNNFINKEYYIIFDETPDKKSRKILNILIGELNEQESKKPFLIETINLEKVNSVTVSEEITNVIDKKEYLGGDKKNFKLMISDKASYCLSAGKILKEKHPNLITITCLCHGLHNFASRLKSHHQILTNYEYQFKKYFSRSHARREEFTRKTNLTFPKLPIDIRWGTWVNFILFIFDNYEEIKNYICSLNDAIELKQIVLSEEFKCELYELFKFRDLPKVILSLEKHGLCVNEQILLVRKFKETIKETKFIDYFDLIWKTTPGFNFFENYNILLYNEQDKCYKYAPLVSVWAERSFNGYRYIYNDLRQRLGMEMIKMLNFFYFNK